MKIDKTSQSLANFIKDKILGRIGMQKLLDQHLPSDIWESTEHISGQLTAGGCQVLILRPHKL
jgi:hypothetical protein